MSRWAKTETSHVTLSLYLWLFWSCIKLYLIGVYALLKELLDRPQKSASRYSVEDGTVAIVTGGASGIGYQVTRKLALRNVHVIIASRCEQEAVEAIAKIKSEVSDARVDFLHLDLASFKSVKSFVNTFLAWELPLHILINNDSVEDGTVAIVTGGASGIGYQVTRKLALRNVHVIIASRCEQEAVEAIAKIKSEVSDAKVDFLHLDLASFKSVKSFVNTFLAWELPLHILINNGVMLVPYNETEDGLETHFQVNYLSHLYLTYLLIDKIKTSGRPNRYSRIINLSSMVHWIADVSDIQPRSQSLYSPHAAYAGSKLAIIIGTYTWSRWLRGDNSCVTVNCLHPGVVNSNLYDHIHWSIKWIMDITRNLFFKTTSDAAESVIYLAVSPEIEGQGGGYYDNKTFAQSKSCTYSSMYQSVLYKLSCECLDSDIMQKMS